MIGYERSILKKLVQKKGWATVHHFVKHTIVWRIHGLGKCQNTLRNCCHWAQFVFKWLHSGFILTLCSMWVVLPAVTLPVSCVCDCLSGDRCAEPMAVPHQLHPILQLRLKDSAHTPWILPAQLSLSPDLCYTHTWLTFIAEWCNKSAPVFQLQSPLCVRVFTSLA